MYRFCTRLVLVVAVTSLLATSTTAFAPSRTGSTTTTTTTTGIIPFNTPATAKRRRRNALACFAQKNTVRGAPTQSFAVSVDSSEADDAIVTEPSSSSSAYLSPPAVVVPTTTGLARSDQYHHHHHKDYEALVPKILNALLLTLAFGSAIYAIINVDSGMTRGWTQSEIAMRIPLDTWSGYEVALEEKPVVTKTIINVVIYLLGDWLSQTVFAKKNILDFDAMRTLRNGFIGLCFGPLVVEYYQFSDRILPVDGGIANRIGKIFMDQTIYLSIKCSIYIMAVGILQGDSVETAAQNVKDKLKGIMFTAWKFWPLVHCVTYSVIPAQHRILWVNMVDLVWNAILATISQKNVPEDAESILEADLQLLEDTVPVPAVTVSSVDERPPELQAVAVATPYFSSEPDESTPLP